MRTKCLIALACAGVLAGTSTLDGQQSGKMSYASAATSKFINLPNLPTCATIAVQDGDPAKNFSIIMIRFKPGCVIPWHWHTPNERLLIVSGSGRAEMKDAKPMAVKPGDFLLLPSHGIHQFTAVSAVELFDISDAPFDLHYVDSSGREVPPENALKPHPASK